MQQATEKNPLGSFCCRVPLHPYNASGRDEACKEDMHLNGEGGTYVIGAVALVSERGGALPLP